MWVKGTEFSSVILSVGLFSLFPTVISSCAFLVFILDMANPQPDGFQSPVSVGRGRGLFRTPIPFPNINATVGRGVGMASPSSVVHSTHTHSDIQHDSPPSSQAPCTSTPDVTHDVLSQMGNIVQHIGQQLADSLLAHLSRSSPVNGPSVNTNSHTPAEDLSCSSQLHIVSQRRLKDPPAFRGDASDTVTLDEWIDLMQTFMKKGGLATEERGEEILVHLRGKAKDVAKVGIRASGIDVRSEPESIYSLLRKHFSCAQFSPLPLHDFYTTLPQPQEDPYDYWLRLNRAADVTAECLREQGKSQGDLSGEATRMFVRNCPSTDLALTFRSKTLDKWSAKEVQEILSEYHREKYMKSASMRSRVEVNVNRMGVSHSSEPCVQARPAHMPAQPTLPAQPACPAPLPTQPLCPAQSAQRSSAPQASADNSAMERMLSMLEKVLTRDTRSRPASRRPSGLPRVQGLNDTPCLVCKTASHTALSHCLQHQLCFQCFSPDHARNRCPHRGVSAAAATQSSN